MLMAIRRIVIGCAVSFFLFSLILINEAADSCADAGGAFAYKTFKCEVRTPYVPLFQRPQRYYLIAEALVLSFGITFGAAFIWSRVGGQPSSP
jgi:hypothetical protein